MDDTMIDITPLLVRMCAEAGIQYDGEQMIVSKDKWQRWQAGLLAEYLQEDEPEEEQDIHSRRGRISRLGNG